MASSNIAALAAAVRRFVDGFIRDLPVAGEPRANDLSPGAPQQPLKPPPPVQQPGVAAARDAPDPSAALGLPAVPDAGAEDHPPSHGMMTALRAASVHGPTGADPRPVGTRP